MFLYPQQVVAEIYISRLGGFSDELNKGEAGINIRAIQENTTIIADETVARLKFMEERSMPFFFRQQYLIVALDEQMEGYERSLNGELILSAELQDNYGRNIGSEVIINTIETFRFNEDEFFQKLSEKLFKDFNGAY